MKWLVKDALEHAYPLANAIDWSCIAWDSVRAHMVFWLRGLNIPIMKNAF
jgi:hypothetical protein